MTKVKITRDDIVGFLRQELSIETPLEADTELFSGGLLDSVSLVNLIGFIEGKARVTVHAADVTLENFDSIQRILDYVDSLD